MKDAEYLISYVWPNLLRLKIGFIDGNVSWDRLGTKIKLSFPIMEEIYFESTYLIDVGILEAYNKMKSSNINAHFPYSKDFINKMKNTELRSVDLTGDYNLAE